LKKWAIYISGTNPNHWCRCHCCACWKWDSERSSGAEAAAGGIGSQNGGAEHAVGGIDSQNGGAEHAVGGVGSQNWGAEACMQISHLIKKIISWMLQSLLLIPFSAESAAGGIGRQSEAAPGRKECQEGWTRKWGRTDEADQPRTVEHRRRLYVHAFNIKRINWMLQFQY
jgi:hypothetical protein